MNGDDPHRRLGQDVFEIVGCAAHRLIADRHHKGEPEIKLLLGHCDRDRAALGDQCHRAGLETGELWPSAKNRSVDEVDEPGIVGTAYRHAMRARRISDGFLTHLPRGTAIGEATCIDHRSLYAGASDFFQDGRDLLGRNSDKDRVRHLRQSIDRGIAGLVQDLRVTRIDRINIALESSGTQVAQNAPAGGSLAWRSAYDANRSGPHEACHVE
jgi:hypothetical protein